MFPNCWPFNGEEYFFHYSIAKASKREQVHFLRSDLFMLAFWGCDICAFVWQRSDSAALKSLQPWELERMMSEAVDDKVRADRAKLIKAEVHWKHHYWRNDLVARLGGADLLRGWDDGLNAHSPLSSSPLPTGLHQVLHCHLNISALVVIVHAWMQQHLDMDNDGQLSQLYRRTNVHLLIINSLCFPKL